MSTLAPHSSLASGSACAYLAPVSINRSYEEALAMTTTVRTLLFLFLAAGATAGWCTPVNVNTADAATIASSLNGIGAVKAQAIVDYRQKHGPFRSVDELAQVKGISQKLINRNRPDLRIDRAPGTTGAAATGARPPARPAPHPASHN
jgi:competence protein ComEA